MKVNIPHIGFFKKHKSLTAFGVTALVLIVFGILKKESISLILRDYVVWTYAFFILSLSAGALIAIHYLTAAKWSSGLTGPLSKIQSMIIPLSFLMTPLLLAPLWLSEFQSPELFFHIAFRGLRLILISVIFIILYRQFRNQLSSNQDLRLVRKTSIIYLLLYFFSIFLLSWDWFIPLTNHLKPDALVFLQASSGLQAALALYIFLFSRHLKEDVRNDVSRYLVMLSFFWFYFNMTQLIIIWYANQPAEQGFYIFLNQDVYLYAYLILYLFRFLLPLILLIKKLRQNHFLNWISALVLIGYFAEFLLSGFSFGGSFSITALGAGLLIFSIFLSWLDKPDIQA